MTCWRPPCPPRFPLPLPAPAAARPASAAPAHRHEPRQARQRGQVLRPALQRRVRLGQRQGVQGRAHAHVGQQAGVPAEAVEAVGGGQLGVAASQAPHAQAVVGAQVAGRGGQLAAVQPAGGERGGGGGVGERLRPRRGGGCTPAQSGQAVWGDWWPRPPLLPAVGRLVATAAPAARHDHTRLSVLMPAMPRGNPQP